MFPHSEYIVYIIENKNKETISGISGKKQFQSLIHGRSLSKLIYYELYDSRDKAYKRKKSIEKMDEKKRRSIILKKNPECLSLNLLINKIVEDLDKHTLMFRK